jgi:hypothetical protein
MRRRCERPLEQTAATVSASSKNPARRDTLADLACAECDYALRKPRRGFAVASCDVRTSPNSMLTLTRRPNALIRVAVLVRSADKR